MQHSAAILERCYNYSKQCCNNVTTLCCAKNRRCESSRVTSPLKSLMTLLHARVLLSIEKISYLLSCSSTNLKLYIIAKTRTTMTKAIRFPTKTTLVNACAPLSIEKSLEKARVKQHTRSKKSEIRAWHELARLENKLSYQVTCAGRSQCQEGFFGRPFCQQ